MVSDDIYCAGLLPSATCSVPMSQLTGTTYLYLLNDLVIAKVRAVNNLGVGPYSEANNGLTSVDPAYVKTVPETPTLSLVRDEALTTTTSLSIEMPEITDNSDFTGGATLTSYNLEWNAGSGTTFSDVSGGTADNLSRTIQVSTTAGETYKFRYRIRNIFGWSVSYSPELTVLSAKIPATPTTVTTTISGLNVLLDWTAPSDNASPITSFTVEIRTVDGTTWHTETAACDGSLSTIL